MSILSRLAATSCAWLALTGLAHADALTDAVIDQHILPTYQDFADKTAAFDHLAQSDCALDSAPLHAAWGAALDAWVAASHLRFGPSEADNRAFAIAFWPDSRSRTPKALRDLLSDQDPVVNSPEEFAGASVAVRGFYALEYLFFDPAYADVATPAYNCALVQAVAHDLARNAEGILSDWQSSYAEAMRQPESRYHSDEEVHQELFKAFNTGIEILADSRLGRPLGTFDHPRPNRAEARRSGRSLRHVEIQLQALRQLALLLAAGDDALTQRLTLAFDKADHHAEALADDPTFAGVSDPQERFRIEALQQDVRDIKAIAATEIGPKLGVDAGFNALDGD
ncbi:imelysin family protein [Phaeobacter sp. HF9A]|uniref:imelysin family protein n=1 Tax=Phaeobacter sp. HF9A TaxID=2721561 RepID=UPI0014302FC5|nr:imelysin family protein [Phaeobacter sp. HF9A]NIZ14916.1 imelysin family protein [Phaeobacter sp. HF9A]